MKARKERNKSTFWKDFKAFISRGNIVDLAVAVVVGAAFTAIVNSMVNDIIKPLIALLVGGDFSELIVVLRAAELDPATGEVLREAITLNYGNLLMAILTFLIDAFVIFLVLRIVRRAKSRIAEEAEKFRSRIEEEWRERRGTDDPAPEAPAADIPAEAPAQATATPAQASAAQSAPDAPSADAFPPEVVALLVEIRDLLKAERGASEPSGRVENTPEDKKD